MRVRCAVWFSYLPSMNSLDIDERFFYLNPVALANIHKFQDSRDPALVQPIFEAIIRNYLPEAADGSTAIPMEQAFATIGLDSMTLLEFALDLQDALEIRLTDEDVRELVTPKEAQALVVRKVEAAGRDQLPPAPADAAP
jgi:acyl carrier protein